MGGLWFPPNDRYTKIHPYQVSALQVLQRPRARRRDLIRRPANLRYGLDPHVPVGPPIVYPRIPFIWGVVANQRDGAYLV